MERALFSMSPMFCSACACLACHPFPPHFSLYSLPSSLSSTTTSAPSPTPSHISAIPSPSVYVDGDGEIGPLCVCVCVCLCEECCPSQPLAPPGDGWGDWIMWLMTQWGCTTNVSISHLAVRHKLENRHRHWKLINEQNVFLSCHISRGWSLNLRA